MGKKVYPALWTCLRGDGHSYRPSASEVKVLARIFKTWDDYDTHCLFSVGQVSRWTGLGRRTVRRIMTRLERAGVINRYSGGR